MESGLFPEPLMAITLTTIRVLAVRDQGAAPRVVNGISQYLFEIIAAYVPSQLVVSYE